MKNFMKKTVLSILFVLLAFGIIFGCTETQEVQKNELLGTWEMEQGSMKIDFVFNENGGFSTTSYANETPLQQIFGTYLTEKNNLLLKPDEKTGQIDINVNYSIDKNKLTLSGLIQSTPLEFIKKSNSEEIILHDFSQTPPDNNVNKTELICQSQSTGIIVEEWAFVDDDKVSIIFRNATGQNIKINSVVMAR